MHQNLKSFFIDQLVNIKKARWKNDGQAKVLISVNDFFTPESWERLLTKEMNQNAGGWDIVFCKNKIEILRHFGSADICFLFGLGRYIEKKRPLNKLLYFPITGIDFLENTELDASVQIQGPEIIAGPAMAEYSYAMAILLTRNLHQAVLNQGSNKWSQKGLLHCFKPISDYKIGIMGLGNIGKTIAGYFAKNHCVVYGMSNTKKPDLDCIDRWFDSNALESFLKAIDILIIALPLTKKTENIIGLDELKLLGPSKFLINISRGRVLNEKDLIHALKHSMIKGAVLDVFNKEPLPSRSPFYKLKNVVVTPHISGNINLFVKDIQQDFIRNALNYIQNV